MIRIVGIEPGARKAQQYFFFGPNARSRAAHAWSTAPKEGGKALREAFSPKAAVQVIESVESDVTPIAAKIEGCDSIPLAIPIVGTIDSPGARAAVSPVATCPRGHLVVRARCTVCTWEAAR